MNKATVLSRVDKEWQDLTSAYAGLSEAEMMEPGVAGSWSIRDVIAHVAWWEEEALTHLPVILAGGRPPRYSVTYGGIDSFNAQMTEKRKGLSLQEVIRQRDDTHRRLMDYLRSVPGKHMESETRFLRRLRLDTYGHYREHRTAVLEWREQRSASKTKPHPE